MTTPFTPIWRTPVTGGLLSNKRGSNTGGDAISMTARYSSPSGTNDVAAAMRVAAQRVVQQGTSVAAQTVWDTGVIGPIATTPLPSGTSAGDFYANSSCQLNGYTYLLSTNGDIYWAAQNGQGLGPWNKVTAGAYGGTGTIGTYTSIVPFASNYGSWLFFYSSSGRIDFCTVNSDGSLVTASAWKKTGLAASVNAYMVGIPGTGNSNAQGLWTSGFGVHLVVLSTAGSTAQRASSVNAAYDSSTQQNVVNLPATRNRASVFYDPFNGFIYAVGGDDGVVTAKNSIIQLAVTSFSNTTLVLGGSWTTMTSVLPGLRTAMAHIVSTEKQADGSNNNYLHIIGGATAAPYTTSAFASTSIYFIDLATLAANGAFTTATNSLPTATAGAAAIPGAYTGGAAGGGYGGAVVGGEPGYTGAWPSGGSEGSLLLAGGRQAGALVLTVYAASLPITGQNSTWSNGTGSLVATPPSGVTATQNPDGSIDLTFSYGGTTSPLTAALALADGDQIQVVIQVIAQSGGSNTSFATLIKIGQPPTINTIASSGGGRPVVSFNYVPGAGGGQELSYRIQVTSASLAYDTGLLYTGANTMTPTPANCNPANSPRCLLPAEATTATVNVVSTDQVYPGSSNSATGSGSITPAGTAPASPTSTSDVVDNVNGFYTLTWTNPGGSTATTNRIYYRATGNALWLILKDSIAAVIGSPQSFVAMDALALNTAYDFAVTAVSSTFIETALVAFASQGQKITPDYHFDLGGWTAMVHVLGNGSAQHAPILLTEKPKFVRHYDSVAEVAFGNTAPTIRTGVYQWRELEIKATWATAPASYEAIVAAAMSGSVLVWRDLLGTVMFCGLGVDRQRELDLYIEDTIKLVELQYVFVG